MKKKKIIAYMKTMLEVIKALLTLQKFAKLMLQIMKYLI